MKMEHVKKQVRLRSDSSAYLFPPILPKSASISEKRTSPIQPKSNPLLERTTTKTELFILPSIKAAHGAICASDFDPEADYDFDQDDDERVRRPYWERVPRNLSQWDILKGYYRRACEKEDVPPSAKFLDQIGSGYIVMHGVGLSRKAFKAICACAVHLDITGLDFSGNSLGAVEMSYLTQLLRTKRNLKDLILADNNINGRALATLSHFLSAFKNTQLRKLDLSGNKLTDDDGQKIANILQYNTDIEEVYLSRNELREHGPIVISKALADNETLDLLDMSWNHIRTAGAVSVANGISQNTKLKTLRVAWNGFGYEGSLAMGHALVHNVTLTELDLSNNRIHPPALFNFMDDMLKNQTLKTLKLASNPIPVCYTSPLLALIARRKDLPLKLLDLSGIIVDPKFESLLEDLKCVRDITVLYDRAMPIHKEKWARMLEECNTSSEPKVINVDPVRTLYLLKQNLRCIDMLVQMDRDESYDLSREEIKLALDKYGLTISSSAMDMIMSYLDTNKDGFIDLRELIDGERRLNRAEFARQEDVQKKGVDTASFSRTFKGNAIKGIGDAVALVMESSSTSEGDKEKPLESSERSPKEKTDD